MLSFLSSAIIVQTAPVTGEGKEHVFWELPIPLLGSQLPGERRPGMPGCRCLCAQSVLCHGDSAGLAKSPLEMLQQQNLFSIPPLLSEVQGEIKQD